MKAIGMEYSPSLCKFAEKNIEIFRERTNTGTQFEIVDADAPIYPIPDDASVFFFFNPFGMELLVPIRASIQESAMRNRRAVLVVDRNPQFPQAFDPEKFRTVLVLGEGREMPDSLGFELVSEQTP
jgi:hypothetical protein